MGTERASKGVLVLRNQSLQAVLTEGVVALKDLRVVEGSKTDATTQVSLYSLHQCLSHSWLLHQSCDEDFLETTKMVDS